YCAWDSNQAFHATQVVLRAERDSAAEVRGSVHVSEIAFKNDIGLRRHELQDDPGEFAVAHQKIRAAAEEFVRNMVRVQKVEKIWNAFVLPDGEQVGRPADSE